MQDDDARTRTERAARETSRFQDPTWADSEQELLRLRDWWFAHEHPVRYTTPKQVVDAVIATMTELRVLIIAMRP